MNQCKKIVSLIMVLIMLFTAVPTMVFANQSDTINLNDNCLFRPYKSIYNIAKGEEKKMVFVPQYTAEYNFYANSKYNIGGYLTDENGNKLIPLGSEEREQIPSDPSLLVPNKFTLRYTLEKGEVYYYYIVPNLVQSASCTVNYEFTSSESGALSKNDPLKIQFLSHAFLDNYSHDAMLNSLVLIVNDGNSSFVWEYSKADSLLINGVDVIIDTSACGVSGKNVLKIYYMGYEAQSEFNLCFSHDKTVTKNAKSANCLDTGYTGDIHCASCDKLISSGEDVPATGHKNTQIKNAKSATCSSAGYTGDTYCKDCNVLIKKGASIAKKAHSQKSATTKATPSKDGKIVKSCTVCKATISTSPIPKASNVTLSTTSYIYDGKVKGPGVTVKDAKGKVLKNGTDYTVSYQSGRKNVGQYTVTVTLKGNYSGTIKKTFNITPKKTSVSKVTSAKKGFKVTWKKQTTQVTGYQIQYSTDKNFKKNNKTASITKNKTTSKSVAKLTGKKKYYVRVRTYKTVKVGGKNTKIYSPWSASKAVTTKK